MTTAIKKEITAISAVQSKKRIPIIREFLNMDNVVLLNLDRSGKMYISTIAYATSATMKIAVQIVQNTFSKCR